MRGPSSNANSAGNSSVQQQVNLPSYKKISPSPLSHLRTKMATLRGYASSKIMEEMRILMVQKLSHSSSSGCLSIEVKCSVLSSEVEKNVKKIKIVPSSKLCQFKSRHLVSESLLFKNSYERLWISRSVYLWQRCFTHQLKTFKARQLANLPTKLTLK